MMSARGAFGVQSVAMAVGGVLRPRGRPSPPPLNARGVKANQRQAQLREAILSQPRSDLFRDLCVIYQEHVDDVSSLDHIPTLSRIHSKINATYRINLTPKSLSKAAALSYEEMTRISSERLRERVIEAMDLWSLRAWRERIRAIDEGDRAAEFCDLRDAYEAEAGVKLLSDDQFMRALKMAAGMRRKRGQDDDPGDDSLDDNDADCSDPTDPRNGADQHEQAEGEAV